jgi:hypothetical protein
MADKTQPALTSKVEIKIQIRTADSIILCHPTAYRTRRQPKFDGMTAKAAHLT